MHIRYLLCNIWLPGDCLILKITAVHFMAKYDVAYRYYINMTLNLLKIHVIEIIKRSLFFKKTIFIRQILITLLLIDGMQVYTMILDEEAIRGDA
jgi:hypothetical protein